MGIYEDIISYAGHPPVVSQDQQILSGLKKLDATDGDVIVLTAPSGCGTQARDVFEPFVKELRKKNPDIFLLVVEEGFDVSLLDESLMRRHGWVRAPRDVDVPEILPVTVPDERPPTRLIDPRFPLSPQDADMALD